MNDCDKAETLTRNPIFKFQRKIGFMKTIFFKSLVNSDYDSQKLSK